MTFVVTSGLYLGLGNLVVIKNLKFSLYLTSLPPIYVRYLSPTFFIVLLRSGYSAVSIYSSRFCSKTIEPFETHVYIILMNFSVWGSIMINLSLFYFYIYLIHRFPWSWGSIIRGYILPFLTSTPFSLLNWSSGSPFKPHLIN